MHIVKCILNDVNLMCSASNGFCFPRDVLLLSSRSKCACLQLTARGCHKVPKSPSTKTSRGYSYKRLEGPVPSG